MEPPSHRPSKRAQTQTCWPPRGYASKFDAMAKRASQIECCSNAVECKCDPPRSTHRISIAPSTRCIGVADIPPSSRTALDRLDYRSPDSVRISRVRLRNAPVSRPSSWAITFVESGTVDRRARPGAAVTTCLISALARHFLSACSTTMACATPDHARHNAERQHARRRDRCGVDRHESIVDRDTRAQRSRDAAAHAEA